jgi:hypothetical protein
MKNPTISQLQNLVVSNPFKKSYQQVQEDNRKKVMQWAKEEEQEELDNHKQWLEDFDNNPRGYWS